MLAILGLVAASPTLAAVKQEPGDAEAWMVLDVLLFLVVGYFGLGLVALLLLGAVNIAIRAGFLTGGPVATETVHESGSDPETAGAEAATEPVPPDDPPHGMLTA